MRASFLPGAAPVIADKLDDLQLHVIDLTQRAPCWRPAASISCRCWRAWRCRRHLAAATNPKSSTGRLDVFTRVIADGVAAFDQIPAGYHGALYAEICPQTFPIVVRQGSRLSQIRFRGGPAQDSDSAADASCTGARSSSPTDQANIRDGIALSVDLSLDRQGPAAASSAIAPSGTPASSTSTRRLLRRARLLGADPRARLASRLILDPDQFYILASKEAVHVPPTHAAEMVPFNPLVGEFRVHYAGFFDPGFGHAAAGGTGAKAVLEVRSHKVPFILEDGQIVGRLIYERLTEVPEVLYGSDLKLQLPGPGPQALQAFQIARRPAQPARAAGRPRDCLIRGPVVRYLGATLVAGASRQWRLAGQCFLCFVECLQLRAAADGQMKRIAAAGRPLP